MVTSDLEDRHLREHSRRSSCPRNLLDGKAVPFEIRIPYSVPHPTLHLVVGARAVCRPLAYADALAIIDHL